MPVEKTWSTGEIVTAAELNSNVRDAINFLLATPRVVLTFSGTTSVSSSASASLLYWDTEIVDSDGMHSNTAESYIMFNTPGLYEINCNVHYGYVSTIGTYFLAIGLNQGGSWGGSDGLTGRLVADSRTGSNNASIGLGMSCQVEQYVNAGDNVQAFTSQTSGSTNSIPSGTYSMQFAARWVASS